MVIKALIKSFSKLSLPTFLNLLASIARNKILAVLLGTGGIGIYSQIINFNSLISAIFPIGVVGITRYTSDYIHNKRTNELNNLLSNVIIKNSVFVVVVSFLVIFFSEFLSSFLFSSTEYRFLLIIFALTIPLSLFANLIDAYFKGLRVINSYVLFLVMNALVNLVLNVFFIYTFGLNGLVLGILICLFINIITGIVILKRIGFLPKLVKSVKSSKEQLHQIYKLGLGGLVAIILQNVSYLIIKSNIANNLSIQDVGLVQGVYSISVNYFGIFFIILGIYSLPKFSTFKTNEEYNNELNTTLRFLFLFYIPIILVVFVFRIMLIKILFADEFIAAENLFFFQLLGDYLKALTWLFGIWFIPKLKIKEWIIFEMIYYLILYFTFFILFFNLNLGLISFPIAYFCAYLFYFIVNLVLTKKVLKFKFERNNFKNLFLSIILVLSVFSLSSIKIELGYYLLPITLLIWFSFTFKKSDFGQIKDFIKNKVNK